MSLTITKGVENRPFFILVHGMSGIGKSTFASEAPRPLFLDIEKRIGHIDTSKQKIASWPNLMEVLRTLGKEEKKDYDTLVFDTLDRLEAMIHQHLCEEEGVSSIEEYGKGYGKGYAAALAEFRRFMLALEFLRTKGYNIILVAHSQIQPFQNPEGENYDRWALKMHKSLTALVKESVDAVGFAHWSDATKHIKGENKAKATTSGKRLLTFKYSPAFDSKYFASLPEECPLEFSALQGAL